MGEICPGDIQYTIHTSSMHLPGQSLYIVGGGLGIVDVLAWPEFINCGRWAKTAASGIPEDCNVWTALGGLFASGVSLFRKD